MNVREQIAGCRERAQFGSGPSMIHPSLRQTLLLLRDLDYHDCGHRNLICDMRRRLVWLGGGTPATYTAMLVQGSGAFGLEAVLSSAIPQEGRLMVVVNGAYGRRIARMAELLGIPTQVLECPENRRPELGEIDACLRAHPDTSMLAVVHCETTTGIINPITQIGSLAATHGVRYFVDAMGTFGGVPIHVVDDHIDYLVSSPNPCLEGVPGFSFVLAKVDSLRQTQGHSRTLRLDLHDPWAGLEGRGEFGFTPPTQSLLAFDQALDELEAEGGVAGRAARFEMNYRTLIEGMRRMGFVEYLPPEDQGYLITAFRCPAHPRFSFDDFSERLHARGHAVYMGKVSDAECFRISSVGRISPSNVRDLLAAISDVLGEMDY